MATTLAPVDSREVVRCDHCRLVQFRTHSNLCRKCHASLDDEPEPAPAPVVTPPDTGGSDGHGQLQVALAIRTLRQRTGLSQRQLAMRMAVPRTYVSKIENEKATPTLSSLQRLAQALQVSVTDLLDGGSNRSSEIRELVSDQFISELVPFLPKLNGMQWASVLAQVREMTTRTPRTA